MNEASLGAKLGAEFLGTFGLVFGGCGSAVLAAKFLTDDGVQLGIGFVGVALAFGLTVLDRRVRLRPRLRRRLQPGRHDRPRRGQAVRVEGRCPYIVTQIVAATIAAFVLFLIASGKAGFSAARAASPRTATVRTHPADTASAPRC